MKNIAFAIHGGAGVMKGLNRARQSLYLAALNRALDAGYDTLAEGGTSLDAVFTKVDDGLKTTN